jgi:hypothetical protein
LKNGDIEIAKILRVELNKMTTSFKKYVECGALKHNAEL